MLIFLSRRFFERRQLGNMLRDSVSSPVSAGEIEQLLYHMCATFTEVDNDIDTQPKFKGMSAFGDSI